MASYGRQAKVGFFVGVFGRGAMEVAAVPTAMVLARLLTPHDFGVAAAAGFFVMVAQRMTNVGFNVAIVRLPSITPTHTSTVFIVNLLLGLTAWLVLALASPALAAFFRSPEAGAVIPVAALSFIIGAMGSVPQALLTRDLKFKHILAIESSTTWIAAVAAMGLAWFGFGYWSLVYSAILATTLSTTLKFAVARWRPHARLSLPALREMWSFAFGVHIKRSLESAAASLDNLVIGRTLGVTQLGIYDKAFTTMNRVLSLVTALGPTVSFSVLAKFQNDAERFRRAHRKVMLGTTLLAYPLYAALGAMAYPLFLVLFGRQWSASVLPFQILCAAGTLKLLAMYLNSALDAQGRVWGAAGLQAIYATLVAIGVFAVTPYWGLVGASAAVLLATGLMTALTCALLPRVTPLRWSDLLEPQVPGLICAGAVALLVGGVGHLVRDGTGSVGDIVVQLGAQGGTAVVTYVAFLLFAPVSAVRNLVAELTADLTPELARGVRLVSGIRGKATQHPAVPAPPE